MSVSNAYPPKTTVNRVILFFIIGFATATPLLLFGFYFLSWTNICLVPLGVSAVLIFMSVREKRQSKAKPKWLELFLSTLGIFYPSVFVAILLWIFWWALYGLTVLLGVEEGMYGDAYTLASTIFGIVSFGAALLLVRVNWRHLVGQLYPQAGGKSAFAEISESGKFWLIKRGILFAVIFVIIIVIYFAISGEFFSEGDDITIGDEFIISLTIVIGYLFAISISAWLWLRQPENRFGIPMVNEMLYGVLKPAGYKVRSIVEIKRENQGVEVSEFMTASVDLVASNEDGSLVIDVMTLEETAETPDWVMASEFRTATWYLQRVLQLPTPVEAIYVLVDVTPDDSLLTFAEGHAIKVLQLTSEEVAEWSVAKGNGPKLMTGKAATLLSSLVPNKKNGGTQNEPMLEFGGQNG